MNTATICRPSGAITNFQLYLFAEGQVGGDDDGRDGILLEFHERLEPTLTADEVIFSRICPGTLRDGDWSLQTNLRNVLDHFFESAPVSYTWIENANSVGGDESDLFLGNVLGSSGIRRPQ